MRLKFALFEVLCLLFGAGSLGGIFPIPEKMLDIKGSRDLQIALLSIEDKFQNLENALSLQCTSDSKIDYYTKKISTMEKQLMRLEFFMRTEIEKVSENISSQIFKGDITKEQIIRKIDAINEGINNRLSSIENQMDAANIKLQNTRETVIAKLDRMKENVAIRDADLEAELADVTSAITDLKSSFSSSEQSVINATKDLFKSCVKSNEKASKKYQLHSNEVHRNITEKLELIQNNTQEALNNTRITDIITYNLEEYLNEYANKMSYMYEELYKQNENAKTAIESIALISNSTRFEQQNALRSLMVQVGKKPIVQSDEKLKELSDKLDANFENVLLAQNMFLENCHRIQMDEPQLETKISIVLEKLIDTFEKMTLIKVEDIENLKKVLTAVDTNMKNRLLSFEHAVVPLIRKSLQQSEEILNITMNHTLVMSDSQEIIRQLFKFENETLNDRTELILKELQGTNIKFVMDYIKNIYHILNSIEAKVNKSYLDYYFNKYNIEFMTHRFGKRLHQYLHSLDLNETFDGKENNVIERFLKDFVQLCHKNDSNDFITAICSKLLGANDTSKSTEDFTSRNQSILHLIDVRMAALSDTDGSASTTTENSLALSTTPETITDYSESDPFTDQDESYTLSIRNIEQVTESTTTSVTSNDDR